MSFEVMQISYGQRPGVQSGYRVCQKCKAAKATHAVVWKRRWWQLFTKVEPVCDSCRPRTPATTLTVPIEPR